MKRIIGNKKFILLSVIAFIIVIFITIIFFKPPIFAGTTTYCDWAGEACDPNDVNCRCPVEKINEDYSYSTVFNSSSTKVEIIKDAGQKGNVGLYNRTRIPAGSEIIVLITNSATNKDGELMDVLVKINNIKSFPGYSDGAATFVIGPNYLLAQSQYNPQDSSGTSHKQQVDEPIVFEFDTVHAQADFTMTYYKAGTYESGNPVLGNISSVSGLFWDLDVPGDIGSVTFSGNEGFYPKVGNSTIYYNQQKIHINGDDYLHELKEYPENGGIAIESRHNNVNTLYYENAAFMATKNIPDSTYSFTYIGSSCGIYYMFASPYPFEIDAPIKSASVEKARPGESFNYYISQYIPNNYYGTAFSFNEIYRNLYQTSRFNSLKIEDTIDENLDFNVANIKIVNESNVDVTTKYFENITASGNKVTATVKESSFNDVTFYAHTYKMIIPVTLKSTTTNVGKIVNMATTTSSICKTDDNCPEENKNTPNVDVKVEYKLTVNYYQKGTKAPLYPTDESYHFYDDAYTTNYDKVDLKVWQISSSEIERGVGNQAEDKTVSGQIKEDTIINYYFEKRPYTLTVNYLEEGTNKPIDNMPADITNPLYYDSQYSTNYNKVNHLKWKIIRSEVQKGSGTTAEDKTISGQIKEDTIINYYFEKIPYGLTVNYYEEGTNNVIADADITRPVYYDDAYETNHDKIEHRMWRIVRSEVAEGEGEVNNQENKTISGIIRGNTVINYYFEKIEYLVTVNYYDAQTKEKIEESDKTIYYFDMKYYTNYDKVDRDIWEYVSTDGDEIEGVITGEQESYTINYYFNRLKYRLKVNYYDDKTKKKIETSDKYAYNYEDEYTTNYDKVDTEYWEYVRTEGETPGRIYEDIEIDYYFKNNEYTIEVNYYDEETGEKIDDPEISSHKYDEEYKTNDDKIDKKKWELVEVPENAEGRVDGDIEVNYYYRRRKYKIIVNYYEEGTENKIAESRESEANYGDKYITDYNNVDGKVWELVGMPDNYQGEIKENTIVNYYFKQVEIKNPQTGTNQNNITKTIIPSIVLITIIFVTGLIYRIHLKKKIFKL